MSHKIERSLRALLDLEESAHFIARNNIDAAMRFLEAAETAFATLAIMPNLAPVRRYGNRRLELRMWPIPKFGKWLIFYVPTEGGIRVIRVLHASRNIEAVFESDDP